MSQVGGSFVYSLEGLHFYLYGEAWDARTAPHVLTGGQRQRLARNGSVLVGEEHDVDGTKYFCVSAWRQAKAAAFTTDCQGLWMPFEQGGLLLHPTTDSEASCFVVCLGH